MSKNLDRVVYLKKLPKGSSKAKAAAAAAGLTGFTTSNVVNQQAWFNFTTAAQAAAAAPHLLASFPGSQAKGVHARAVPSHNPPVAMAPSTPPKKKKTPKEAIVVLDMVNIFRDAEGIASDMGLSGFVDCGSSLNKKTGVQSG